MEGTYSLTPISDGQVEGLFIGRILSVINQCHQEVPAALHLSNTCATNGIKPEISRTTAYAISRSAKSNTCTFL